MNPAFGAAQIRELTDIFVENSIELRNAWESEARKQDDAQPPTIDVLSWLSRMTLDVIGLAGMLSSNFLSIRFGLSVTTMLSYIRI